MNAGIWVFIEQVNGTFEEAPLKVLSEGRKLADKAKEELSAVLFGEDLKKIAVELAYYGADRVLSADRGFLAQYQPELYVEQLSSMVEEFSPSFLLFAATPTGRDLAPRVAARIKAGVVANCDGIDIDGNKDLIATKPIIAEKLSQKAACQGNRPQMATILPEFLDYANIDKSRACEIVEVSVELNPHEVSTEVTGFIKGDPKTIDIADADMIVAVGGGLGKKANLKMAEELAEIIGASIGGSRVVVDNGWLPFPRQIGQTGKTVVPRLMITIGVSGAIQFTMGMKNAKLIIANDKNKEAPIFKVADFGLVGDFKGLIPALSEKLREYVISRASDE